MTKRNIILIIVFIIIIAIAILIFSGMLKTTSQTTTDSGDTNFFSEFFPFGKNNTNNNQNAEIPVDISGYVPPDDTEFSQEKLAKISSMPIAGYGIFMKERYKETEIPMTEEMPIAPETEFVPALRYVEKATGNIYQTFADKIEERKFTTTIIPQAHEAYFGNEGESVIMRYLKGDNRTIESFVGSLPKDVLGGDTAISNEVVGSFLPENITDMNVSPNKLSIFYLFNSGENVIGVTANINGDKKNQIFNSPFTEWLVGWPNDRMITINTKPSFAVPGYMYSIDPNTKKITKILGGVNGLTTLASPSGKLVLYSNNSLTLRVYNTDTESSTALGIKTMPEKCIWSDSNTILYCIVPKYMGGNNYPDVWYQGEISFSDEIWKINIENGSTTLLANPSDFNRGEEIDGIKLSLDENENYLFFVNKKDSYLWKFHLN